jgi:hypothetical protein
MAKHGFPIIVHETAEPDTIRYEDGAVHLSPDVNQALGNEILTEVFGGAPDNRAPGPVLQRIYDIIGEAEAPLAQPN